MEEIIKALKNDKNLGVKIKKILSKRKQYDSKNLADISKLSGVYIVYQREKNKPIYVGRSKNLRKRILYRILINMLMQRSLYSHFWRR